MHDAGLSPCYNGDTDSLKRPPGVKSQRPREFAFSIAILTCVDHSGTA